MSRSTVVLSLLLGALAVPSAASAQTYSFGVPDATMDVDILPDGTIGVDYDITFMNDPSTSPIDVVDVGMPTQAYDIGTMRASVDGHEIGNGAISRSTYIATGVQVQLGESEIEPGAQGHFAFHYDFSGLVFSDTTSDGLASFRITPTWFDDSVVQGTTHLVVRFHFPAGVRPEEVLSQGVDFDAKGTNPVDGRTVVSWEWTSTRFTSAHLVAASFPRRGMTGVVEITKLDLLLMWWGSDDSVPLRVIFAVGLLALFGFGYFRFTGMTGFVPFLILVALGGWLFVTHPGAELVAIPVLPPLVVWMEISLRRSKKHYLPPIVSVEGGGIKRGLTAPEAAVLLEVPLSRVLTMVIFGLLKKGLLTQVRAAPLRVVVPAAYRDPSQDARRAAAATAGVVVQGYEHAFLDAIVAATPPAAYDAGQDADIVDFTSSVQALVQGVADRVAAFDVDETKKYYRQIVDRAWIDARSVGEIAQRDQAIDKNLEWMLVGDDVDRRFGAFGGGYTYFPLWMRPMPTVSGPSGGMSMPSLGGAGGKGGGGLPAPSFGDVSASFAGWFGGVSSNLATTITPQAKGSVLDLSGFDKATGAVLKALASNSGRGGGGGGHGGGCACACAGCACACACAGGGR